MDHMDNMASNRESGFISRPNAQVKPIRRRNRMINSCLEVSNNQLLRFISTDLALCSLSYNRWYGLHHAAPFLERITS